jgi:molybdenum cofactor sulfurtransferase
VADCVLPDKVYLDHGGTTIYAKSLIDQFSQQMTQNLYGNPHSNSDPARLSSEVVEEVRLAALKFFKADPEHFDLVFTANATAAIKLVGECFSDLASSKTHRGPFFYGYHRDSHTSLIGIRELTQGAHHCFDGDAEVEEWLDGRHALNKDMNVSEKIPALFAYPGQSNMTGRRLPLSWPAVIRSQQRHGNVWTLLDAAALATTTQLDLSDPDTAPDFTALSFYKIFGFPDLGALMVRKKSGRILTARRYFGGGTITMLTVHEDASVMRREVLHEMLEEGTLPFHSIIALGCAMDVHQQLYGSMDAISQHTSFLARRLYTGLFRLRYNNGRHVCVIYNEDLDHESYTSAKIQGGTVAFNVVREDGTYVEYSQVEMLANNEGIFVRSGGLCNAGGIAHYLKIHPWQWTRNWAAGFRCGVEGWEVVHSQPTGVVRASLGAMSTAADVDTFLEFMHRVFVIGNGSVAVTEDIISAASKSTAISRAEEWIHDSPVQGVSSQTSPTLEVFDPAVKSCKPKVATTTSSKPVHPRRVPPRVSLDEGSNGYHSKHQAITYAISGSTLRTDNRPSQDIVEDEFEDDKIYPNRPAPMMQPNHSVQSNGETRRFLQHKSFVSQPNLHQRADSDGSAHMEGKHRLLKAPSRWKNWVSSKSAAKSTIS